MKKFLESFSFQQEIPKQTAYQSLQSLYREQGSNQRPDGSRTLIKDIRLPEEVKQSLKLMDNAEISPKAIALLERYANFVKNIKSFEGRELRNLSPDDRSSLITERQKKTLENLNDEQRDTIDYYAKRSGYKYMNDYCRRKELINFYDQETISKHVQTMDDALKDAKLPMNIVLKKDITLDRLLRGVGSDAPLAVGQVWVDSSFVSTSHAHDRLYPLPFEYKSDLPSRIFINAPKASPGLLIESLVRLHEHEIVLPRNPGAQFNEILISDTSKLSKKDQIALHFLPVYTIKASFIGMRGK